METCARAARGRRRPRCHRPRCRRTPPPLSALPRPLQSARSRPPRAVSPDRRLEPWLSELSDGAVGHCRTLSDAVGRLSDDCRNDCRTHCRTHCRTLSDYRTWHHVLALSDTVGQLQPACSTTRRCARNAAYNTSTKLTKRPLPSHDTGNHYRRILVQCQHDALR